MPPRVNHRAKLAELKALRQSGKKAFENYQVDDADNLYDEVDEDGYKKIVRDRLNEDDFVVDDNGEGYADDGREDWDRVQRYESDSEEEGALPARGRTSKAGQSNRPLWPSYPKSNIGQPRKHARTSRLAAMPMTGTLANTSQRVPSRRNPRQR